MPVVIKRSEIGPKAEQAPAKPAKAQSAPKRQAEGSVLDNLPVPPGVAIAIAVVLLLVVCVGGYYMFAGGGSSDSGGSGTSAAPTSVAASEGGAGTSRLGARNAAGALGADEP